MTEQGHNQAPAHEEHAAAIRELEIEAAPWLTGANIPDDDTAAKVQALADRIDAALKAADAAEEAEKRPHLDAARAVREAYGPTIATAKRLKTTAINLLGKWRRVVDERKRKAAEELRREAEAKAAEARAAIQASAGDYEARIEAERLAEEAKTHEIAARTVAKAPSGVKVGGRALRMVKVYEAHVPESRVDDAIAWLWAHHFDEAWREVIEPAIRRYAERDMQARKPAVGRHDLGSGAVVVTVREEAR